MKIAILTHGDDLDGQFCAKLIELAYNAKPEEITKVTTNYTRLAQDVVNLYNNRNLYDRIYITDLSISTTEPVYSCIKAMLKEDNPNRKVIIVDHHMYSTKSLSNIKVAENNDVYIQLMDKDRYKTSATLLLYRYLTNPDGTSDLDETSANLSRLNQEVTDMIITDISDWDTWMWASNNNTFAKDLQKFYCSKSSQEAVVILASYCQNLNLSVPEVQQLCKSQITAYDEYYNIFKQHIERTAHFVETENFKVALFLLPDTIKQEYKALFIEESLREQNVFDVDFFMMGDGDILRVYCNTKPLNTILKPAGLGYNNSGRTYSAIPIDRVAKYLKCEANRSWEYYFDKIQYNLNSI